MRVFQNYMARVCAAYLSIMLSASTAGAIDSTTVAFTEAELRRISGDYSVSVYPKPFGFLVRDGRLHVKVGGTAAPGDAAPLIQQAEGRFVLSEGHPNAFQFVLEPERVVFRFWSAGQSFDGTRVGSAESSPAAPPARPAIDTRTRRDLDAALPTALAAARRAEATLADRLALARLHYERGEFEAAHAVIRDDASRPDASDECVERLAKLDFLLGRHAAADSGYKRLAAMRSSDLGRQAHALVGRLFVLYQQDRYRDIAALAFPAGVRLPLWSVAKHFERDPYRIEWHGHRRESRVRFRSADPLPVLTVLVDGTPVNVILDTGADQLILDDRLAQSLGIAVIDSATGSFAGGLGMKVGFGRVASIRIGDVSLHDVPVQILPAERFTFDPKHRVGGIIGTGVLRHFLSTVDHAKSRLILLERGGDASMHSARRAGDVEIPFYLDATHLMFAHGGLNEASGLLMFVDSGLASDAALVAPEQTLRLLGIPIPETKPTAADVGGGAGSFDEGFFDVQRARLGPLELLDLRGEYGALTPESYWARGFIQDALISHRFMRRYATWTFDFDTRTIRVRR